MLIDSRMPVNVPTRGRVLLRRRGTAFLAACAACAPLVAFAQERPSPSPSPSPPAPEAPVTLAPLAEPAPVPESSPSPTAAAKPVAAPAADKAAPEPQKAAPVKITPLGYVEAYYAYNLNRPSNGITNARGFDNRHNTFSVTNVVLGATAEGGPLGAKLALQVGSTPSTYYLGEPNLAGTGGANASNSELWKYLQEAYVTYKAPVGRGLLLQLGLSASPVGYEVLSVKDNWNWSRSNLFYGLPYYHTGLRATQELTKELSAIVGIFNGWNSVVDNNEEKSVQATLVYKIENKLAVQTLYFGGIERPTGSPEGPRWRHHLDATAQFDATEWLSFAGQGDYGWETTRMGPARWIAGALYGRVRPVDKFFVTLRGDRFHEHLGTDGTGRASSPLFWGGVEWVSSATLTLDVRPHENLSVRLEGRHDVADEPLFFASDVSGAGVAGAPYLVNARTQTTLLLGATAWF